MPLRQFAKEGAPMKPHIPRRSLAVAALIAALGVPQAAAQSMAGLFQMMGGMDTVSKLAKELLQTSANDPRLASAMGKLDVSAAAPKLADQMCSMLGGGCKAPLTEQQIAAGASKLDASQTKALGDNFSSVLGKVTGNPFVKEGVGTAIGPKLGGIVGGLL
jgi:hypothetical protein